MKYLFAAALLALSAAAAHAIMFGSNPPPVMSGTATLLPLGIP